MLNKEQEIIYGKSMTFAISIAESNLPQSVKERIAFTITDEEQASLRATPSSNGLLGYLFGFPVFAMPKSKTEKTKEHKHDKAFIQKKD